MNSNRAIKFKYPVRCTRKREQICNRVWHLIVWWCLFSFKTLKTTMKDYVTQKEKEEWLFFSFERALCYRLSVINPQTKDWAFFWGSSRHSFENLHHCELWPKPLSQRYWWKRMTRRAYVFPLYSFFSFLFLWSYNLCNPVRGFRDTLNYKKNHISRRGLPELTLTL